MMYLSEKISAYQCPSCLRAGRAEEWVDDAYVGLVCGECGEEVKWSHDEDAQWWSVGVYAIDRSYGGPEEGGWWYDTGELVEEWRVCGFQNIKEAKKYMDEMKELYHDHKNLRVEGFTEQLPVRGFPKNRPVYC